LLEILKTRHKHLDKKIELYYGNNCNNDIEIQEMKKQKLYLKDEITKLEKGAH
jgi:uncharacterized protein YdcH (DUF465 family)